MVSRSELIEMEKRIRNEIRQEMGQKIRQMKEKVTIMLETTTTSTSTTTASTTSTTPNLIIGGP